MTLSGSVSTRGFKGGSANRLNQTLVNDLRGCGTDLGEPSSMAGYGTTRAPSVAGVTSGITTPTTRGPTSSPHPLTSPFHPPAQGERGSVSGKVPRERRRLLSLHQGLLPSPFWMKKYPTRQMQAMIASKAHPPEFPEMIRNAEKGFRSRRRIRRIGCTTSQLLAVPWTSRHEA